MDMACEARNRAVNMPKNAKPAHTGCKTSRKVSPFRTELANSGCPVNSRRSSGISYPSRGAVQVPSFVRTVGRFKLLLAQKPHTPKRRSVAMLVAG